MYYGIYMCYTRGVTVVIDSFGLSFLILDNMKTPQLFASTFEINLRYVDRFPQSRVISV